MRDRSAIEWTDVASRPIAADSSFPRIPCLLLPARRTTCLLSKTA